MKSAIFKNAIWHLEDKLVLTSCVSWALEYLESLLEACIGHLFHLGFAVPSEAMHKYFDDYSL